MNSLSAFTGVSVGLGASHLQYTALRSAGQAWFQRSVSLGDATNAWHDVPVTKGPGLAATDRRRESVDAFMRLLDDPTAFASAAQSLEREERLQLPRLVVEDCALAGMDPSRSLAMWLSGEDDAEVVYELTRALRRTAAPGRGYRSATGRVLWLVREPAGETLEVRDQVVRYHATSRDVEGAEHPLGEIVQAAAPRLWSQRGALPEGARRFASFFDAQDDRA